MLRFRLYKAGARLMVWLSRVLNAMAEWFNNRSDWWIDRMKRERDRMVAKDGEQEEE